MVNTSWITSTYFLIERCIGMGSLMKSLCDEFECYFVFDHEDGQSECVRITSYRSCEEDGDFQSKVECEEYLLGKSNKMDREEEMNKGQEDFLYNYTNPIQSDDLNNRTDEFYNTLLNETDWDN